MPKPKTGNVRFNFMVEPKVLKGYRALAQRRNTTASELLRRASREWLIQQLKGDA